jgi:hypothetical protein
MNEDNKADETWCSFIGPNNKNFVISTCVDGTYTISYGTSYSNHHFPDRLSAYAFVLGCQFGAKCMGEEIIAEKKKR